MQTTLKDFRPKATEFLQREVRIGVPSGRILDVMGSELRFVTSCQLIQRFLEEYYFTMVRDLLDNEATLAADETKVLQLKCIEVIVKQTKEFFFSDLRAVIARNHLQPVLETLDSIYVELFRQERSQEYLEVELGYFRKQMEAKYRQLLKSDSANKQDLFVS